uniref:Tyrosinase copper-binding domain-containing protein n=1 Tax=Triticum urartu TaxID=4572 RepID=A0A8R7QME0_TRIUA
MQLCRPSSTGPFRAGQSDQPGDGSVELSAHDAVHAWTSDIGLPNLENMGTYYSAGRDPLFYPHHNNIDRLWQAWCDIGTAHGYRGHVDFTDPDWLDSSFLFYDEESRMVRITVRDVLDTEKLQYRFDGVGTPWADGHPPTTPNVKGNTGSLKSVNIPGVPRRHGRERGGQTAGSATKLAREGGTGGGVGARWN